MRTADKTALRHGVYVSREEPQDGGGLEFCATLTGSWMLYDVFYLNMHKGHVTIRVVLIE